MNAVPKKKFEIIDGKAVTSYYPVKDLQQLTGLDLIYQKYFSSHNCEHLLNILNKFSTVDAVLTSGDTHLLLEYKRRFIESYKYLNGPMIERDKYRNLMDAVRLFNAPGALYVQDYFDGIVCCWLLTENTAIKWETQICPKEEGSNEMIEKEVGYLSFDACDIVVSKKSWNRVAVKDLKNYFDFKIKYGSYLQ